MDAALLYFLLWWLPGGGDESPSTFHRLDQGVQALSTNGIECQIYIMNHLLDCCCCVIDCFGAERTHEIAIRAGCGADYLCALPTSELDRKQADASRGTLDQYPLSSLQFPVIEEPLLGRRCS